MEKEGKDKEIIKNQKIKRTKQEKKARTGKENHEKSESKRSTHVKKRG